MDHYIDVQLRPDAEMRENVLLNKVYTKLHKALYALKSTDIGVSFPKRQIRLGDVIRLHGTKSRLEELQNSNWTGGMTGYCRMTQTQPVPSEVMHMSVSRKQSNMTTAKLNRLIKRGSISNEEKKKYKEKMFKQGLDNPYLEIESCSNGNKHRRYLQFIGPVDKACAGQFDQFGLSKSATVPFF